MNTFTISLIATTLVIYGLASSLQSIPVLVGRTFEITLASENSKAFTGIKRLLHKSTKPDEWQFWNFCNGKNAKTCGVWVDEKGNKIQGANNNVKKETDQVVISSAVLGDSGTYARVPENKDENQAILERVDVYVQEGPKPPKL